MKTLLITKEPNKVTDCIKELNWVDIEIIDLNHNGFNSKKEFELHLSEILSENKFNMLLTYRCQYIIPSYIRRLCKCCINIHPLKLPEFSGLNPWGKAKESDIHESEITIHIMSDIPDNGRILATKSYKFENISDARAKADETAAILIKNFLHDINGELY